MIRALIDKEESVIKKATGAGDLSPVPTNDFFHVPRLGHCTTHGGPLWRPAQKTGLRHRDGL